ncbi:MAG: fructosamine kinase family protein [Candidatus Ancillula sp.]|nr:fructosamine kinase family protein [Candidatus Ancillula sp.]
MCKTYRKSRRNAPAGFFFAEHSGLLWLKEAERSEGARVVTPLEYSDTHLTTEFVKSTAPTHDAAFEFGVRIARTHTFEVDFPFGFTPSIPSYYGPLEDPLEQGVSLNGDRTAEDWLDYFTNIRLRPMLQRGLARGNFTKNGLEDTENMLNLVASAVKHGTHPELLPPEFITTSPARIHGDLWSGNIIWSEDGVVAIDPAAIAGCYEEDLAMLNAFGCPHYSAILDGYSSVRELMRGWQWRQTLHNLHPIAGHVTWFGSGYIAQYRSMVRKIASSLS